MARFSQTFTLKDIFNNKNLKGKLPLINYREIEREDGKLSVRTNAKTVNRYVFDTATSAARPFYKGIKITRNGNFMEISGELIGDHDSAVDAVYNALQNSKSVLSYTANNADMIRSALKESEKNKRNYGINSKLYLRCQSMAEIEGMSKPQLLALMNDIMENIIYGDNFPKTQAKYKVEEMKLNTAFDYKQRKIRWKYKVGDI